MCECLACEPDHSSHGISFQCECDYCLTKTEIMKMLSKCYKAAFRLTESTNDAAEEVKSSLNGIKESLEQFYFVMINPDGMEIRIYAKSD